MGKILNFEALATTPLRRAALDIAEAGYAAIDTAAIIRKNVSLDGETLRVAGEAIALAGVGRIILVGVGKCARRAALAIEKILGDRIAGGAVIDIEDGTTGPLRPSSSEARRAKYFVGDHPYPSNRNVTATKELVRVLQSAEEGDLVLAVVSGGGSTLLCFPENDAGLETERGVVGELFKAGADIVELNTIRKHLSRARGGFLAEYARPAEVVSLIISDVPGDSIEFISSGPFVKDTTTVADAKHILKKYAVEKRLGFLVKGLIETPKDDASFLKVRNALVVSGMTALRAMQEAAERLGWNAAIADAAFTGEARDIGARIAKKLHAAPARTALLYGGESTVTVTHEGKGGRSQELALSAARSIGNGELILSFASDGRDNTDHAGALCDILTVTRAKELGLDIGACLDENASYRFFEDVGDYLSTGNTGSNVSDLIVAIKE